MRINIFILQFTLSNILGYNIVYKLFIQISNKYYANNYFDIMRGIF